MASDRLDCDDLDHDGIDRRTLLTTMAAGVATTALAGCSTSAGGDSGNQASFGGWMDGVSNYDGVVEKTGASEVTVTVGAKGNQANYAFAPAAVKISTGTTVVWEWNGKGGNHNVVAESGDFESERTDEEGHTFSVTFESAGTYKYACEPHEPMGMKGVVVVE